MKYGEKATCTLRPVLVMSAAALALCACGKPAPPAKSQTPPAGSRFMPVDKPQEKPGAGPVEVATDTWAVRLAPGADPDKVAAAHGARNLGPIGSLEGYFLFHRPEASVPRTGPDPLARDPQVLWLERQVARQQTPKP